MLRRNPRETMLPLAVTYIPVSLTVAAGWIFLMLAAYPDANYDSPERLLEDSPRSLLLWLLILTWGCGLFVMVGMAATLVSVRSLLTGKPIGLAHSLDPAFSRMGGLLGISAVLYLLTVAAASLAITIVGTFAVFYLMLRLGLAYHTFMFEHLGVGASLRESWKLVKGRTMALLGIWLSAIPVAVVFFIAVTIVLSLALLPFGSEPGRNLTVVLNAVGFVVLGAVFLPTAGYLCAVTTMYYLSVKPA
jgi:membrane-anchored glycerophosphoryl diester phosphodiesterase (GDPDase)